jgi:hypothetical protein
MAVRATEGLVDAITVAVGLLIVAGKFWWRWSNRRRSTFALCVADLLNGAVVTPFLLMVGAVFSTTLLDYLRTTSPLMISLAGAIGLFFVLSELYRTR